MVSAILLAAGKGSRMKSDVAKQYMEINGKPLLYYSLKVFDASVVDEIILVTRREDIDYVREEIVQKYGFQKVRKIVPGGRERYDSVEKGIRAADKRNKIVMIHDSARPCVTNRMILDSISGARRYRACTVAMPVKDTIKIVDENLFGIETPDRNVVYQIQTPQTFDRKLILDAYERLRADKEVRITDDTMLVEKYMDVPSKMIEGSYENIKVTTPEDIQIASIYLN
ncbi:MAG: 2-C-methyl-D-erythritol 4-phosphate cytidylyltransferase [Eubacterium sp.]|nr:2-C-methyl-D-erythritol 4-phosphate cytidylyltransferase [Eubacterium sp.]